MENPMHYAMLLFGDESDWDGLDKPQVDELMGRIMEWVAKWRAAGKLASGGEELDTVRKAKTIRLDAAGAPVVTDGPYLELKEVLGGFLVIDAEDIDEAVAIAAGWPALRPGHSVEVRPVMNR
jgi:hypothetical protein